jgi:hypothetical protein
MRLVFIIVPLVLIVAIGGFVAWKIAGLKQRLVNDLQSELHAKAQIASLDLDIGARELRAAGISLQNQRAGAPWDTAAIDQVSVHFQLADLLGPTLPVQVKVTGWKVNLHTTALAPPTGDATADASDSSDAIAEDDSETKRVHVTSIATTQGEVTIRLSNTQTVTVHGVSFHAETHGGADWTTQLQVDSIDAGTLSTGSGSVQLHSEADKVAFSDLAVHCADGQITGNGDIDLDAPHTLHGTFNATSVPITMLVATRWQVKVSGLVTGDATYQGDDNSATATGKISVAGGKFNLFPWLGKVIMLVGLPDITDTTVDQATSEFSWKDHLFTLQNIDVRKNDVFRISGGANIAADDTIDAHLKLGLPSSAVSRWPALQTNIFSVAQDDFSWTEVHVTGTPDSLSEDLSSRLLTVGAAQGGQLIQQTTQKATDLLNSLLK